MEPDKISESLHCEFKRNVGSLFKQPGYHKVYNQTGLLISLKISKYNLTAWLADVLPPISIGHGICIQLL